MLFIADEVFRPLGLTNGQYSLLMSLNRPQPPTIGVVAGLLAMDRTTLIAALKPLSRRGLVAVESDKDDGRNRRLRLTRQGHALLGKAWPLWKTAHEALEKDLGAGAGPLRGRLARLTAEYAAANCSPSTTGVHVGGSQPQGGTSRRA